MTAREGGVLYRGMWHASQTGDRRTQLHPQQAEYMGSETVGWK